MLYMTDLQLPADQLDFDDYLVGEDFALSPYLLRSLASMSSALPRPGLAGRNDDGQLILDEHELALC